MYCRPRRAAAAVANKKLGFDSSSSSDDDPDTDSIVSEQEEADTVVDDPLSTSSTDSDSDLPVFPIPCDIGEMASRNGDIVWQRQPVQQATQPRQWNIIRQRQGPTASALKICGRSPLDAFTIFCTPSIVRKIATYTNQEGCRVHGNQWQATTEEELYTFFGLLLLAGVDHAKNASVSELWSKLDGRPIFNRSMTRDRFTALRQCIRFDEKSTRAQRQATDKFAPL
jgi:hypothetical protein